MLLAKVHCDVQKHQVPTQKYKMRTPSKTWSIFPRFYLFSYEVEHHEWVQNPLHAGVDQMHKSLLSHLH